MLFLFDNKDRLGPSPLQMIIKLSCIMVCKRGWTSPSRQPSYSTLTGAPYKYNRVRIDAFIKITRMVLIGPNRLLKPIRI